MKTNRKEFIKASALLGLGALTLGVKAQGNLNTEMPEVTDTIKPVNGKFELPPLGYAYNSLEPFIDAMTMEIHYSKHHKASVNKLNEAIAKEPSLANKSLEDLLMNLSKMPSTAKSAIKNHGGGHWNHSFFWKSLKTGTSMGPKFEKLCIASFGNIETFTSTFEKVSMGVFGSGWTWLILQNGQLKIKTSPNQENPLMDAAAVPEMMPKVILGID